MYSYAYAALNRGPSFPEALIAALNDASIKMDKVDYSRYGWLLPSDVEVLNAMVSA
jgi:hypothetical protein